MKHLLIILILFCSLPLFAEIKLAMINDPDGFTNIRSGKGNDFPIVDKMNKDEFFYCDLATKDDWIKVLAMKWNSSNQVEGYMHRSRIQMVEQLNSREKKSLIIGILDKQRILALDFLRACRSKDSLARATTVRALELHADIQYSPILDIIPGYFCIAGDTTVLQLFYTTMWADRGSANEGPSFAIGRCFICKPDLVIEQIGQIKGNGQKRLVLSQIEWGILNYFEVEENSKSTNKEFNELKARLDSEIKKITLR